ncbi:axonemal dynein light intermediate polypeptide 1-like [Hippoglossus hippoglossus]|uniref:axonemal dynein light intermediate polypeptide 1-like n=1 Tax=Hippoglossus hippoglossus TaxID=8267 RepID=UPI00148D909A|nr:axonemal dynein light intermediate polypeptide 1-like [Hippoglossus hippoglossus]
MKTRKSPSKRDDLSSHHTQTVNFNQDPQPPQPQTTHTVDTGKTTVDILNEISPPWEFMKKQNISSAPASRLDVMRLQELLDTKLKQRQAKERGICPFRRELYSQCLDELIRQVTITCSERGLLLLQIRNEIQMTLAAYETLYESGVASGMRKYLQAEQGKVDMEKRISDMENEIQDLREELEQQKDKCDEIERNANEKQEWENERLTGEIESLKRVSEDLKIQLHGIGKQKKQLPDD